VHGWDVITTSGNRAIDGGNKPQIKVLGKPIC
jgi:hypothetical protein